MTNKQLLCVGSNGLPEAALAAALAGFEVRAARGADEAGALLRDAAIPIGLVVLAGAEPPPGVDRLLRAAPGTRWIALCAPAALSATACRRLIREHCVDFHTLPVDVERLRHTLGHAWGCAALEPPAAPPASPLGLTGDSAAIERLRGQVLKVAAADAPVLIWGESGSGKELVARAVHACSDRARGPFVPINCGAIPAGLVQSELFGHERGAFTGAGKARAGLIETAAGGSVFLDEIGDLPLDMQVNLLRFLQEKTVHRLGGTRPVPVDVRVIAASHVRLEDAVARGAFREDLFYRLNVLALEVPPLRARPADVPALADAFFRDHARERAAHVKGFSHAALQALRAHHWPGNVRELHNRVRRAAVMAEGRLIQPEDLGFSDAPAAPVPLRGARVEAERRALEAGLDAGKSIAALARELCVSRMTVYRLIARHGLAQAVRK